MQPKCSSRSHTHKVEDPMNEYLNHFVAPRNTRALAALGELVLVISRCRTDQFSQSFLPAAVRQWNLRLEALRQQTVFCQIDLLFGPLATKARASRLSATMPNNVSSQINGCCQYRNEHNTYNNHFSFLVKMSKYRTFKINFNITNYCPMNTNLIRQIVLYKKLIQWRGMVIKQHRNYCICP